MSDIAARLGLLLPQSFVEFAAAECDQSIHQRFQQQARRYADGCAVRQQSGDVTYAVLNAAANRAARLLLAAVGDDSRPVALMLDQGYESIVWTLAILKAGLCYAPLDQRLPESVLRGMIENLRPAAVVAAPQYCGLARSLAASGLAIIQADAARENFSAENLDRPVSPDAVAYIFYTSGSTGAPKGVADSHRNVLHNILRYTNSLKFAPGDILSLVQNPSFSGTVSSLFGALLNGATVAPYDLQGEGLHRISQWLRRAKATVFHAVPSIFRQLSDPVRRFPSVRLVRLEGDRAAALDIEHFQTNFRDDCTLVNGLGATECGLVRQFFIGKEARLEASAPVPIGYPVADMTVRVVDDQDNDIPAGAAGEIVVESRFLATGYWRNPALTAERFVALGDGQRRYRTGDLGRMSEDGCLVHLGRVDQRIRIGGEFVAAADVEKMLLSISGVQQVAVRDFVDQHGECRLCAYLVTDANGRVTVSALRESLSKRLAQHHLPSAFVFVDRLPLTKDLKVDYANLPLPGRQRPRLVNDYVAPQSEIERQMARLWSTVLELDEVGVADSFFDLGGDSLRGARFVTLLKEQQGQVVHVTSLFEHRTIRALVGLLDNPGFAPLVNTVAVKENNTACPEHSIAIIGMAGRFPGADSIEQFWDNLRAGIESITVFADKGSDSSIANTPGAVAARGLLSNVDQFDAALFRLTPRQAQMLDPQQRLWLECVHRALEDAGIPISEAGYSGEPAEIGVFVGGRESSYLWHLLGGNREAVEALLHRSSDEAHQLAISNDTDSLATRTAFVMGFTGPAINIQTACSTSLVAVAQACQALVSRQCDLAIAGGVSVTLPQTSTYSYHEGGIYSRDGHCRAFDAKATGTVFGDGAGAVVLKRLEDTSRDGDRIDAVIRGWAVNNDGSNKASFAAPSVNGQAQVIIRAQDHAGVQPKDISYVEAHGTGTPVGDPIEFAALARAFRRGTNGRGVCGLGTVKTNIGHLDAAAGIAGLIKTVLALQHREIPATLHFERANPEIDLDASPFYIVERLSPWTTNGHDQPLVGGVSSFGIGGTNCHVVLQEAPIPEAAAVETGLPAYLLTVSAASEGALDELEGCYRQFFEQNPMPDIARIAATTQRSRSQYSNRTAIVGKTAEQIRNSLSQERAGGAAKRRWRDKARASANPEIGFLFAGQGSQYVNMGRELFQESPKFRSVLERCDEILRDELERSLLDVMFAHAGDLIQTTEYAQPALFALEYALAELLQSWGIKPKFVMGHSLGEYVAACVAGVFTLEDGLLLAAARGRLMQQLPGRGKMLAVSAEQGALDTLLQPLLGQVSIAAINSPNQVVLSGEDDAIDRFKSTLLAQGTYCRELAVSHAFHSAQMDPALAPLRQLISKTELQVPRLCLIGNLHGRAVTNEVTDPDYWCQQSRHPVQFAAGFRTMVDAGCDLIVEIGPDIVFSLLDQGASAQQNVEMVPTLRRGENDWTAMLATLARVYVQGVPVNWTEFQKGQRLSPVRLPNYPFQRSRHWYEGPLVKSQSRATIASDGSADHPLLGRRLRLPGSAEIRFQSVFSQSAPHFLNDHRLFGVSLPPAACHFAMLAQAAEFLGGTQGDCYRFEDLYLLRPLLLPDGCERDVQLIFKPDAQGWSLELTSAEVNQAAMGSESWTAHMIGLGRAHLPEKLAPALPTIDLNAIKARCADTLSRSEFYSRIWANQGGTGSAFRWIETIWQGDQEALCRAVCPAAILDAASYRLHPGLIEAACQVLHCCATIETEEQLRQNSTTFVPFSVDVLSLYGVTASQEQAWCYAQLREHSENNVLADLSIVNDSGELVARLEGFRLRPITQQVLAASRQRVTTHADGKLIPGSLPGPMDGIDKAALTLQQVVGYLQAQCAELSGYPESAIFSDQGFMAMGLDSLVAMILSNRIRQDFGCAVSAAQILLCVSIESLAEVICESGSGTGFL